MEKSSIHISKDNFLPDIISNIRKGDWKIPRFQREFVWEKNKVIELFDSMYRGFPIGSFFLWIPPQEYAHHYKDIPELLIEQDDRKFYTHFILDGQQRLTSLYVTYRGLTINGQDYSSIAFDLDREKFNADPSDNDRNVPVCIIFQENYHEIYNRLNDDRKRIFMRVRERFSKYPFPVVIIEDKNIEEACKIFERINQGGKRLGIFDLVVAVTWDKDFELKDKIDEFNQLLVGNFGKVDEEVFSETLSLVVYKQCTRVFQLKLTPEDVKNKWEDVKKAIGKSIQFLRTHLKVKSYSYLPYRDMLALIAYYFYECEIKDVEPNKQFLEDWFWKVSFANRYSGSSFNKMGEDRGYIFDRALNGESPIINYDINIDLEKIKAVHMGRKTAWRNALILIMIQQTPLSFKDSSPIDLEKDPVSEFNNSEKHHIFPKKYLKSQGVTEKKATDLLVNFCLIDSELNKEISGKAPQDYFPEYRERNANLDAALTSHLLPNEGSSAIWSGDYKMFIEQRAEILLRQVRNRVGDLTASVEEQIHTNPARLIQKLEQRIRENINNVLYEEHGENWWDADRIVPQDVRDYAKNQIKKEKATKPYISDEEWNNSLRRLEQINVMDYLKIVLFNWPLFEDIFGSKRKLEQHFESFSTIRNQINHNKTLDPTERKLGETAIEWLLKCLEEKEPEADGSEVSATPTYLFVNELYESLKTRIFALGDGIHEKEKRNYKAFSTHGFFNFCSLRFRKDHLRIRMHLKRGQLNDPEGLTKGFPVIQSTETARCTFEIYKKEQLDAAIKLIQQAYTYGQELSVKKAEGATPKKEKRFRFWSGLLEKAKQRDKGFENLNPTRYHWKGKGGGKRGLRFVFVIWDNDAWIELYFDAGKGSKELNKKRYDDLLKNKQKIENQFGSPLSWERLDTKRGSRIASRNWQTGLQDEKSWGKLQDEMIDKIISLEKALAPFIAVLPDRLEQSVA